MYGGWLEHVHDFRTGWPLCESSQPVKGGGASRTVGRREPVKIPLMLEVSEHAATL